MSYWHDPADVKFVVKALALFAFAIGGITWLFGQDKVWCAGNRIEQADVIRECIKTQGCKVTPSDLDRMHRVESRCIWQRENKVE